MEGPKLDELKELELAPEGKHWKSMVNKVQNQRQERMQPGLGLRKAATTAKRSNINSNSFQSSFLSSLILSLFNIFSLLFFYSLLPYHFSPRSHNLHNYRPFSSRLETVHLDLHPRFTQLQRSPRALTLLTLIKKPAFMIFYLSCF